MRLLAHMAQKFLRAYDNELNWDVWHNGEATCLANVCQIHQGEIVDVGANNGQWTTMAAAKISDRAIHSLEIVPDTFHLLKKSLAMTPYVSVYNVGLGCDSKIITLNYYPDSSDRSTALDLPDGFHKMTLSLPVMRGDDFLVEQGITSVSYLKIDVEGMEMDVLDGFRGSLKSKVIGAVQFEHGPSHVVTRHFLRDFIELFEYYGYKVMNIFPNGPSLLNYDYQLHENFIGKNYLAVRSDLKVSASAWRCNP